MKLKFLLLLFTIIILIFPVSIYSQQSVARQWNEVLLEAIREDFARPTIHARNLFHTSVAIYDAWDASNVASGVYFYRLRANDFIQTKKMVLLK